MRPFFHRGRRGFIFSPFIWIIGFVFLAKTGWWWPGIFIIIGLAMLASGAFGHGGKHHWHGSHKRYRKRKYAPPHWQHAPRHEAPRYQPQPADPTPPAARPQPSRQRRTDPLLNLPGMCPACGAPVNASRVDIRGGRAHCAHCGTGLTAITTLL